MGLHPSYRCAALSDRFSYLRGLGAQDRYQPIISAIVCIDTMAGMIRIEKPSEGFRRP